MDLLLFFSLTLLILDLIYGYKDSYDRATDTEKKN